MKYPALLRLAAAAVFVFSATVTITGLAATVAGETGSNVQFTPANEQGHNRYMITFAEPGLLHRQAGRASGQGFDINAPGMSVLQQQLQTRQAAHRQAMENVVNRSLEVTHHYLVTHSGMAVWLTSAEAEAVARLDGVVSVERERVYELDTYRGPEFIGADAIWDGSSVPDNTPWRGEGVAIAVLDTGVDPAHPSFANATDCPHGNGDPDKLLSFLDCSTTDGGGLCNGPEPEDVDSHGSHTASTAGGNVLDGTENPPAQPPGGFGTISGVAPCAHVRTYRVCDASCPGAAIQAGMNSVLLQQNDDGIDIAAMNFSISGGQNPWGDSDRRKLDLVDAGVFVAASAGNTRPEVPNPVGNVNHRGPWVLSVAASTRDVDSDGNSAQGDVLGGFSLRGPTPAPFQDIQKPDITGPGVSIYAAGSQPLFSVTGPAPVPPDLEGIDLNLGSASPMSNAATPLVDQPIRYDPGQDFNAEGCDPGFPPNFFNGDVALIRRGNCAFTEKINNAAAAGASLVIIWNNEPGLQPMDTTGQDPDTVAGAVTQAQGQAIRDFIDGAGPGDATIEYLGIRSPVYYFTSGTSMSSPHLAGAATLVRQANPDWTVSEVKSAMQMTAFKGGTKENGTTPWDADDVGSGRVDLTNAALAGLVMDEVFANYLAANPNTGGDPKTLNLPAVRNVECTPNCSWTRTVRNTLDVATTWNLSANNISAGNYTIDVSPATLNFTGDLNQTEEITITVTPVGNLTDAVYFGEVVLSEAGDLSPELHITVAFMGSDSVAAPEIGVDPASLSATLPQNQSETQELTISNSGNATLNWGIADGGGEPWEEDFDSYDNGSNIHGQGGWKGWFNNPALGATVSDAQSNSAPHSLQIQGDDDPVREFAGIDSGRWTLTAMQYVPNEFDGESYFILLNTYNDQGQGLNWSTQVSFDSVTGLVANTGSSGGAATMVTGQWVELRVEIDLDSNTQTFYYDGQELFSGSWTEETSGGGAQSFGAVNLFANDASAVYYDDVSLVPDISEDCDAPADVPWLNVAPTSGSTAPGGSSTVNVTFDPDGLAEGTYDATLCVASNDPVNDVVEVPVTLEVTEAVDLPEADITPASFEFEVPVGGGGADTLNIGNIGEADLEWDILDGGRVAGRVLRPAASVTLPRTSNTQVRADGLVRDELANAGEVGVHPFANPRGDLITITHSESMNIASANAVACANEGPPQTTVDNQFLRTFTLSDFDIDGDFDVTEVTFGIENLTATVTVNVNLYTLEGSFVYANLTPIGSASANLAPQELSLVNVPVTGAVPAGSTLVVEIEVPTLLGQGVFFPGSNSLGETAPSYIASAGCGINNPVTYASIGFAQVQLVMAVTGTQGEVLDCELPDWLNVSPDSGITPPGGSVPVDVTVDATGLEEGEYEAQLCVATNDPSNSLVTVPVTLTVAADLGVLEVTPAALAFGQVEVGDGATGVITVTNAAEAGGGTLTLDAPALSGDAVFALTGGDCAAGTELEPQQSCTVEVGFAPDAEATFTGEVTIGAGGQSAVVPLSGTGVDELFDEVFSDRFEE